MLKILQTCFRMFPLMSNGKGLFTLRDAFVTQDVIDSQQSNQLDALEQTYGEEMYTMMQTQTNSCVVYKVVYIYIYINV